MLKICTFLVKILFWQMQNAVLVSKFCKNLFMLFTCKGKMRLFLCLMAQICVIKTTQGKNPKKFSEFYAKFDKFCYNYAVFK